MELCTAQIGMRLLEDIQIWTKLLQKLFEWSTQIWFGFELHTDVSNFR